MGQGLAGTGCLTNLPIFQDNLKPWACEGTLWGSPRGRLAVAKVHAMRRSDAVKTISCRRLPSGRLAALIVLTSLLPLSAMAGGVFLNGVRIDGVRDQVFEGATVRIDSEGNVHIDAPKYRVTGASASLDPATAPRARTNGETARLSRRYFIVTQQTRPGATQYDIDVYVNARWIRKLRGDEPQVIADITEHLVPGSNRVLLTAVKSLEGGRRSHSPEHVFRVVIGEGDMGGNRVMIERPLIQFERNASDVEDVSREFDLDAR